MQINRYSKIVHIENEKKKKNCSMIVCVEFMWQDLSHRATRPKPQGPMHICYE